MPSAALILASLDDDQDPATQPLLLTLGGETLLERLIHQATRLGCPHILVCAASIPFAMTAAIGRAKAHGHVVSLARSPREAVDLLHPEEQILLFATAFVMPDRPLAELLGNETPTLLTLPESWGRDRFERIDSVDNWAGVALLPATLIRETVSMLGDWAFGPTLLRRAVQAGVARRSLGMASEGEADDLAPLQREDLSGTARALVKAATAKTDGFLERRLMLPAMRKLAGAIALKPVSANMMAALALFLWLAGLCSAVFGLAALSMILLAVGCLPALLSALLGQVGTAVRPWWALPLRARPLLVPLALVILAGNLAYLEAALQPMVLLLLWVAVQAVLLLHLQDHAQQMPSFWIGGPGLGLVFAVAVLLNAPLAGLTIGLLLVLAAQIAFQKKVPPL